MYLGAISPDISTVGARLAGSGQAWALGAGGWGSRTVGDRRLPSHFLLPTSMVVEWHSGLHSVSLAVLDSFTAHTSSVVLTLPTGSNVRLVHAEADEGTYSEGQAYGFLLCSAVLSALPPFHTRWADVSTLCYEYYLGWRRMCEHSRDPADRLIDTPWGRHRCLTEQRCGANGEWHPNPTKRSPFLSPCPRGPLSHPYSGEHECLAGWKFDATAREQLGIGSTADADADAILAMVLPRATHSALPHRAPPLRSVHGRLCAP